MSQLPWKGHREYPEDLSPGPLASAGAPRQGRPKKWGREGGMCTADPQDQRPKGAGGRGSPIWPIWSEPCVRVTSKDKTGSAQLHNTPAPRHPHTKLSRKGYMKMASSTV